MIKETYPIKVEDGNVCAVITLRDVVEDRDVSDLPILAEIKRLYTDNDKLRELVRQYHSAMQCMFETETWPTDPKWLEEQMEELGIEVD